MAEDPLADDMLLQRLATLISRFTRNYGSVLNRATAGQLQVLSRNGEQFVLLSMAQACNLLSPDDHRTIA